MPDVLCYLCLILAHRVDITPDYDIWTSAYRTAHISSGCSFLSNIRQTPIHSFWAVSLATYGYGQDNMLLLLCSRPSTHIISAIFLLWPFSSHHRKPVDGILVQILCDICSSMSYGLSSFVTHCDLLLICLWAQLPDRTSLLANQKECL